VTAVPPHPARARTEVDAVVVGSGPNGLAAAVTLARAGLEVLVLEEQPTAGGGARTLDLGLAPGVVHDLCSAVHPMAWASPFFRATGITDRLDLLTPVASYAQPLDGGRAAVAFRDLDRTAAGLGVDGPAWRRLLAPLALRWDGVVALALGDHRHLPAPGDLPTAARFGAALLRHGTVLPDPWRTPEAAALLTGVAAHATTPLPSLSAAGTALLLAALGHASTRADGPTHGHVGAGWPVVRGGSGAITAALLADLAAHGGRVLTDHPVRGQADLPPSRLLLLDTSPHAAVRILGDALPSRTVDAYGAHRYGAAAAKVDLVVTGPVPWAHPEVALAGTVHLGGDRVQVARAEHAVTHGRHADAPVVLLSDPASVDPGREVDGLRPVWAYAHVPAGSPVDPTEAVLRQVERFAPGFRDTVVAARGIPAARMAAHDANLVGGDVAGGAVGLGRMLLGAGGARVDPYGTGVPGVLLCSASVPPGPGVHGMAGWHAARRGLRWLGVATR
jgi:phytoene dehydrogenase-like protein